MVHFTHCHFHYLQNRTHSDYAIFSNLAVDMRIYPLKTHSARKRPLKVDTFSRGQTRPLREVFSSKLRGKKSSFFIPVMSFDLVHTRTKMLGSNQQTNCKMVKTRSQLVKHGETNIYTPAVRLEAILSWRRTTSTSTGGDRNAI